MLKLCSCYVARVFLSHLFIIPFFFDFKQVLREAYELRKPGDGILNHSDSGSQYTSKAYKIELACHHALQSMMTGKRYDNARMKSFFAALKKEKRYRIDTTKLKMQEVKKLSGDSLFTTTGAGLPQ